MNITVEETKDRYFIKADGACIREFARDIPHIETIVENYRKNAGDILAQTSDEPTKPAPWQQALLAFIEKAESANIEWFLSGSCALAVRGLKLEPRNVNVILELKDLAKVQNTFLEDTIVPIAECSDWVAKGYGEIFIHAVIDMAFDTQDSLDVPDPIDSGPYAKAHLETIDWMGHTIKVPPVALILNINKRRGRQERVRLIDEYMNSGTTPD